MKYSYVLVVATLIGLINGVELHHKQKQSLSDEVDDIIARNDAKEANEQARKEFDDAGSKMN